MPAIAWLSGGEWLFRRSPVISSYAAAVPTNAPGGPAESEPFAEHTTANSSNQSSSSTGYDFSLKLSTIALKFFNATVTKMPTAIEDFYRCMSNVRLVPLISISDFFHGYDWCFECSIGRTCRLPEAGVSPWHVLAVNFVTIKKGVGKRYFYVCTYLLRDTDITVLLLETLFKYTFFICIIYHILLFTLIFISYLVLFNDLLPL